MTDGTDDEDEPVARPTLSEGDLYVFSDEDIGDAMGELYAWIREIPGVSEDDADEICTIGYELLTEGWAEQLSETDDE